MRTHPLKRVEGNGEAPEPWVQAIPAVAQVLADGLDLEPGVTFFVGENGSGKSTLLEAIAEAAGLPVEGGDRQLDVQTWRSESSLSGSLRLHRGPGSRAGFFLRAETMHGWITRMAERGSRRGKLHTVSHGESFLAMSERFLTGPGLYLLDEPEAALSYGSTLALLGHLHHIAAQDGAQVLCATHSPILAALPGATILEVSQRGLEPMAWDELELVQMYRLFLEDPQRQLRHVTG